MRRRRGHCLDRKLAVALVRWLSQDTFGRPKSRAHIAFSMHEQSCDEMVEVCTLANWKPRASGKRYWSSIQARLRNVALRLTEAGVLRRWVQHNQVMYIGEPANSWQYAYQMTDKWLARLYPKRWGPHVSYTPEDWSRPKSEWRMLMRRLGWALDD